MKNALLTIAGALICLSGCAVMPWPHTANVTPHVRGVLLDSGQPLQGAEIRVVAGAEEGLCLGRATEARTSADGSFEVESVKELRMFVVMMAHSSIPWSLCYRNRGNWVLLASEEEYTLADTGPIGVQVVQCDLNSGEVKKCDITWVDR